MRNPSTGLARPLYALVVAIIALSAGCAIPTDSKPRALSADELPEGLVPTSTVPISEPTGTDIVGVWYQTQVGGLQRVGRSVETASVQSALEALFEPTPDGSPNRLTNQWNDPNIALIGLELREDNRLTVNLSAIPPAAEGALAGPTFAQLVWTVTQTPFGVDMVRLQVEGEPIRMVAGESGAGFIARSDFASQPEGVPVTPTNRSRPTRTVPAITVQPAKTDPAPPGPAAASPQRPTTSTLNN
ncbi:MAG: GerMN domain-containing protein [Acidobacteria bacterium]|nr:GerMN domain-containing protein [Acidobacteriota bacterium]